MLLILAILTILSILSMLLILAILVYSRAGGFNTLLLVCSLWPLAYVLLAVIAEITFDTVQSSRNRYRSGSNEAAAKLLGAKAVRPRREWSNVGKSVAKRLQRALPLTLILTFVLFPTTSNRIFSAFLCSAFTYDDDSEDDRTRSYLLEDLSLPCDSPEYNMVRANAVIFICAWPLGVPLLYATLLWMSRHAILLNKPTPLSRATAFLTAGYGKSKFWCVAL